MSFNYYRDQGGSYFPIIPFQLSLKDKVVDTAALIDSGAAISIMRVDVAEQLGIAVESGKEIFLGGVGGRIKGYLHNLDVEVAGRKFAMPVVFSREYLVSFNLLGRSSFFENFVITFREKKRVVSLDNDTE